MISEPWLPEKLGRLLTPVPWCGCWLAPAEIWNSGNGYAKVKWDGEGWQLHRLVWTFKHGPICPLILLDHICRVRWCSNPAHLDPCYNVVNTRRGNAVLFKQRSEYVQ